MQLINITSQPLKYEIHTEAARLEMNVPKNPQGTVKRAPSQMRIRTKDIEVRLDTTEMRASLNLRSIASWKQVWAQQGQQAAYEVIGENVQTGNQMQRIDDGVTIGQIVRQKMLQAADCTTYTTYIPSEGTEISWDPAQININYDPGSVQTEWQIAQNVMNYIPGKFQMEILQYPKVTIEYLGEPTYVPPSAAPGYVEE